MKKNNFSWHFSLDNEWKNQDVAGIPMAKDFTFVNLAISWYKGYFSICLGLLGFCLEAEKGGVR